MSHVPCPTSHSGWTPSHSPKDNGGTRGAAHKRCGGVVPVPQASRHPDRPRGRDKRRQGGPRTGQAQSEVRRGGISNPFILCVPLPLRLTAAVPSRGANWRRHSAGRALGRREHLRRGFASSAPGMKDIRNPARLIAGPGPISTPRGALAPLPQPTSQGPSK